MVIAIRLLPLVLISALILFGIYHAYKWAVRYYLQQKAQQIHTALEPVVFRLRHEAISDRLTLSFDGEHAARIIELAPGITEYRSASGSLVRLEIEPTARLIPYLEDHLEVEFPVRRLTIPTSRRLPRITR